MVVEVGYLGLVGDATNDDVLEETGIIRANAIACVTGSDTDNTVITLSARKLNPNLLIVSRAQAARARATRVISPIRLGVDFELAEISEYLEFYNRERFHQRMDNQPLTEPEACTTDVGEVTGASGLGGRLRYPTTGKRCSQVRESMEDSGPGKAAICGLANSFDDDGPTTTLDARRSAPTLYLVHEHEGANLRELIADWFWEAIFDLQLVRWIRDMSAWPSRTCYRAFGSTTSTNSSTPFGSNLTTMSRQ